ncbi:ATP-binding protein [Telluribacter humicola]|uniref:ATP-binding protein n=1 Tax=Telluribacter humicola TaxID=1720261 RepID=UPI001A97D219|nr:ATP-binding protein [Telluribacter humicola]
MEQPIPERTGNDFPSFLSGGGEMGQRIREYDWSTTPLGNPEQWPQSLKTCVRIMLTSPQPMFVWWGRDTLINIYNDAYRFVLGGKHPEMLGKSGRKAWAEIWDELWARAEIVFTRNEGTFDDALLLVMNRYGYEEETYFKFSYNPIPGDKGGTEGLFCVCTEETSRVITERSLTTLRSLAVIIQTNSLKEIFEASATTIAANNKDFLCAIIYTIDEESKTARATAFAGIDANHPQLPLHINIQNPDTIGENLAACVTENKIILSPTKGRWQNLPTGAWSIPPKCFVHAPIKTGNRKFPVAVLSVGLNPYRKFDESYQNFIQLVADQIALEAANALAYEEERKRAEALAEIDRAKTAFFTNISHEFRTPITLMLGSLEDLLRKKNGVEDEDTQALEMTHRNSLRLLRLVNNLLDFNRIEAGKVKAQFTPIDLAKYTTDLASGFRSVIESAGLEFNVQCDKGIQPVHVDKEMWEKIVLNLLSNAFKYTLAGSITISLSTQAKTVVLKVTDTGVGIPGKELSKIFQRFHRVENSLGRSFEGTGIGLSLVKELVMLHKGEISVSSKVGLGSEFSVTIPTRGVPSPEEQFALANPVVQDELTAAFLDEVTSLTGLPISQNGTQVKNTPRVLVVDDNADMRAYLRKLLEKDYTVVTASNGREALIQIEEQKPDLVVSDIMMPVMDGLQLLTKIKTAPHTSMLPVILLSARAGEEARIEGLNVGVDDYLIKPFSAKELLAKVRSNLAIDASRRKAEKFLYDLLMQAPVAIAIYKGPNFIVELANDRMLEFYGKSREEIIDKPIFEAIPEVAVDGVIALHRKVYETGERVVINELLLEYHRKDTLYEGYFNSVFEPFRDSNNTITGVIASAHDVTEQVLARKKIEESESRFRTLAETLPQLIWVRSMDGTIEYASNSWEDYTGIKDMREAWKTMTHPDDWEPVMSVWQKAIEAGLPFRQEVRLKNREGEYRWQYAVGEPVKDDEGKVIKYIGALTDIHVQKTFSERMEEQVALRTKELQNTQSFLQQLIDSSVEYISVFDKDLNFVTVNKRFEEKMQIDREQLKGQHLFEYNPKAKGTEQHRSILKALSGETVHLEKRSTIKQPDIFVDTYFFPLVIDGNVEGVIIMARDVTAIVESEIKLEEVNRELQRSNEDLQQFAHVASHDLKEPVRKIMLFSNRLKTEFGKVLPEKGQLYLSKVESSAIRMYSMIDGVLLYSSLNALEQTKEGIELEEIIQSIVSDLEVVIAQKEASILFSELPWIEGSNVLIYQLFYNLINNSLKFSSPERKPLIRISSSTASIEEIKGSCLNEQKEYVKISLQDNGIGFGNDEASRIFGTFTRLHSKDKFEGTGLGLALCKKIAERHGGIIYAQGQEGEGATFTLLLPK